MMESPKENSPAERPQRQSRKAGDGEAVSAPANAPQDLTRIMLDGGSVCGQTLAGTDAKRLGEATARVEHWDAVQIIPTQITNALGERVSVAGLRAQYALADLIGAEVRDNLIYSTGKSSSLQAITCFDGLLRNVRIKDNVVSVSSHEITLLGALSGEISGNVKLAPQSVFSSSLSTDPLVVRLRPARVGGSPKGLLLASPDIRCQLHILSWKPDTYWPDTGEPVKYGAIVQGNLRIGAATLREGFSLSRMTSDGGRTVGQQLVIDQRASMCGAPYDRYLFNFDLPAWIEYMLEHLPRAVAYYEADVDSFCGWLQQEACMFGDWISGDSVWTDHYKTGSFPTIQEFLLP